MKNLLYFSLLAVLTVLLFVQIANSSNSHNDDDRDTEARWALSRVFEHSPDVAPATHSVYIEECSGCHMTYPPGLLPARSWQKLMSGLDEHFGDNAELDTETRTEIMDYLTHHSADNSQYRRSKNIVRSLDPDRVPLRITELPYIRHEHDEIPNRLIAGNAEVGSLSRCESCHRRADQGLFSENDIRIPGFGKWDD